MLSKVSSVTKATHSKRNRGSLVSNFAKDTLPDPDFGIVINDKHTIEVDIHKMFQ